MGNLFIDHARRAIGLALVLFIVGCGDEGTTPESSELPPVAGTTPGGPAPQPAPQPTPQPTPPPNPAPPPTAPPSDPSNFDNRNSAMGINLSTLRRHSTENPFSNEFKRSQDWLETGLNLDDAGWPRSLGSGQQATALMFSGGGGHYQAGRYIVTYEGNGELSYDGMAELVDSSPGRDVINVPQGNSGIHLKIVATDPSNYVRNIRVVHETLESSNSIFHPEFLSKLKPYRVLRFMDFYATNESELETWDQRTRMTDARWSSKPFGPPPELSIELANELDADPWFSVPHKADDNYVTELAKLYAGGLEQGLVVYIEYGNEIWNSSFDAADWVEARGVARWNTSDSAFTKRANWFGMRSAEICRIFKQHLGDRAKCVMGSHAANGWYSNQVLSCPLHEAETGQDCAGEMDALAIAPYFGPYIGKKEYEGQLNAWTNEADGGLASLFNEIENGGLRAESSLAKAYQAMDDSFEVANNYGIELIAYEGGQHLVGVGPVLDNVPVEEMFKAANRDYRMYTIYREYLDEWRSRGGKLFAHYKFVSAFGRFGSWGAYENHYQASSPKAEALLDYTAANPCWWEGCAR